jgi:hypothetical protein
MVKIRNAYTLVLHSEGKRPTGRTRRDNRIILKCDDMDWIHLARVRDCD